MVMSTSLLVKSADFAAAAVPKRKTTAALKKMMALLLPLRSPLPLPLLPLPRVIMTLDGTMEPLAEVMLLLEEMIEHPIELTVGREMTLDVVMVQRMSTPALMMTQQDSGMMQKTPLALMTSTLASLTTAFDWVTTTPVLLTKPSGVVMTKPAAVTAIANECKVAS